MLRTAIIAPIVFAVLALLGVHRYVAALFESPSPGVRPGAPAVVAPPAQAALVSGSGALNAAATAIAPSAPTPSPVPPSPTPVPRADQVTQSLAAAIVAALTVTPPPATATATAEPTKPPTATPTIALDVAPPPKKVGTEKPPQVAAKEIVVVDGDSGAILYEQNAHKRVAPASTTKIVTALVALQHGNLRDTVTADFDPDELYDSTLMGIKPGEKLTLEDLLYGLMLPSGNDAALAIASQIGGSKTRFVGMMNELTSDLGLHDSHWVNPHGLDAQGHYSSAYDLVQFARLGMKDPRFQALAAAKTHTVHTDSRTFDVANLNRLLGNVPGADGVKIGYTDDAGRTLVGTVTRNGHRVYVGLMQANDLVVDSRPLFEWAFRNYSWG